MSLHVCIQFILRKRVKSSSITPVLKPLPCEQKTKWNYVDISFPIEKGRRLMVYLHWQWPILRPRPVKWVQNPMGICVSICLCTVWTPPHNHIQAIFIDICIGLSVGQCKHSISRSEAVNILSTGIWNQNVIRRHHFYACVQMLLPLHGLRFTSSDRIPFDRQ